MDGPHHQSFSFGIIPFAEYMRLDDKVGHMDHAESDRQWRDKQWKCEVSRPEIMLRSTHQVAFHVEYRSFLSRSCQICQEDGDDDEVGIG